MKTLILFSILSLAFARPNLRSPAARFSDGKIIGGSEAPKRKYISVSWKRLSNINVAFEFQMNFPGRFL